MTPLPVKPLVGSQLIVIPDTEIPDTIDTVPIDMVKEPEIAPALSTIEPDAPTEVPKSEVWPFALNDHVEMLV